MRADEVDSCIGHQRGAITFAPDYLASVRVEGECAEVMPRIGPHLPILEALPSGALRDEFRGLVVTRREVPLANVPRVVARAPKCLAQRKFFVTQPERIVDDASLEGPPPAEKHRPVR